MRSRTGDHKYKIFIVLLVLLAVVVSCDNNAGRQTPTPATPSAISKIQNKEHFKQIIATSGDRLLVFEFYADWCPPCKELAPILEEIARENRQTLDVYKINTDKLSGLTRDFRVTGIPHVVFFKNKESVMSLSGLYPKQMYQKVVGRLAPAVDDKQSG